MFKFITFFAILSVAYAGGLEATAPVAVAQPVFAKHVEEYDPHPRYHFAYEVQDALTGDSKSQVESRDGDVVQGQYWLVDADGHKRIVDYTADAVNGFNAVVRREPLGIAGHSVAAAVVKSAPIAFAVAPAQRASPLKYSSVSPALIQSAPVASYTPGPAYVQSAPYAVNRGVSAFANTIHAPPAVYAQTAHTAPSAYVAPATYAQSAYSTPVTYGSHRLINAAPAAIVAHNSYASPAVLKPSSIASYDSAGPSKYSNFQGTPLASPALLKAAYTSPISSYAH